MNNNTDSFCKHNHPSDNLKLKSILSIFTIGIFIFLGFASIEEGYPETEPVDCEFYPTPITKTQIITIEFVDKQTGNPIVNQDINLIIVEYEKVFTANLDCEVLTNKSDILLLNSGPSGKVTLTRNKAYVSKEDVIQIKTFVNTSSYGGIFLLDIYDYHSNLTVRYGLLKKEQYP